MTTVLDLNAEEKASPDLMSRNEIVLSRNRWVEAENAWFRVRFRGEFSYRSLAELRAAADEELIRHNALIRAHNSVFAKAESRKLKNESEFFVEVKEALVAEGKAEHVATNLIDTEAKLLAQAKRLGII